MYCGFPGRGRPVEVQRPRPAVGRLDADGGRDEHEQDAGRAADPLESHDRYSQHPGKVTRAPPKLRCAEPRDFSGGAREAYTGAAREASSEPAKGRMVVDVIVTVWAADALDYEPFELVVVPVLQEIFGAVHIDAPALRGAAARPTRPAFDAPLSTSRRCRERQVAATVDKGERAAGDADAGVRGVVSVLDGWPVLADPVTYSCRARGRPARASLAGEQHLLLRGPALPVRPEDLAVACQRALRRVRLPSSSHTRTLA